MTRLMMIRIGLHVSMLVQYICQADFAYPHVAHYMFT